MSELTYTSGVTGQVFDLESKLSWGAALGLRSREWDYSLTYRGLGMPTRKAREVSVSMSVINPSDLDAFMRATDADIQMNQPGVITGLAESGAAWTQHAVIVKTSPQSHHRASDASIDLTIVLLDGVWRRRLDVQHFWSDVLQPGLDLDYPHDYPHADREEHDRGESNARADAVRNGLVRPRVETPVDVGGQPVRVGHGHSLGRLCDHFQCGG